jgi:hypothetical protein
MVRVAKTYVVILVLIHCKLKILIEDRWGFIYVGWDTV